MAIGRIWRGTTLRSNSAKYLRYLNDTGMKDYERIPGRLGSKIMTRHEGDQTEFVIVSLWKSMDAIKEFAGDDLERARYYPKDKEFLLEPEPRVKHYKVVFQAKP